MDVHKHRPLDKQTLSDVALQMAMLAQSGLGPRDILASALEGVEPGLDTDALDALGQGSYMDEALAATGAFPEYFTGMLGVGLDTGKTESSLSALHAYYLRLARLEAALRRAMLQPLAMLAVSAMICGVILTRLMPVFHTAYLSAGMHPSAAMGAMMRLGSWLSGNAAIVLAGAAAAAAAVWAASRTKAAKRAASRLAGRSRTGRRLRSARLMQALAMGLDSGLGLQESIRMACGASEGFGSLDAETAAGKALGAALLEHGAVTKAQERILASGSDSGHLPDAVNYVAGALMDEAEGSLARISGMIEPAVTLLGTAMAGGMVLTAMLPLLDAMASIG